MRKNASSKFIRGGQTTQHGWRMAAQVVNTGLIAGVLIFVIGYTYLIATNYEIAKIRVSYTQTIAEFTTINKNNPTKEIRYKNLNNVFVTESAQQIYANREYTYIKSLYEANAKKFAYWAMIPALFAIVVVSIYFYFAGSKLGNEEHIRGSRLVDKKELIRWSKAKWKFYKKQFKDTKYGPEYTLAGVPFPPNAVEAQTAICGTVGVGKTTSIKELLNTIRENGGRAIIYDKMGGLLTDYYDPSTDIVINPFDARSVAWSPFNEARTPEAFAQIAEVMIPDKPDAGDPFWSQTARLVFEYVARSLVKTKGHPTNADLRRAVMEIPADELQALIENTPGAHFFGKHIEKTAAGIRANMIAELRFLEFLRDDGEPFSIREWVVEEKPGFVFLTGDAEHSAATRNIISTIFEVGANALMTCEEQRNPSVWFFLDEVPSLNKLPFLVSKLAEIRQFGGAFVLGFQVYSQLEYVYGEKGAQSISGNLNNRIVFNTPDARTAKVFSDSLGFEDLVESRENITVGAHATRDGVGFMQNRIERAIVTPSQIQALPQFEAYVRFAYDAPTAKVIFKPITSAQEHQHPKFVEYTGKGFDNGGMDTGYLADSASSESEDGQKAGKPPFISLTPSDQLEEYNSWFKKLSLPKYNYDIGKFETPYSETDRVVLWPCFASERMKGKNPGAIKPSLGDDFLMGSTVPVGNFNTSAHIPPYPVTEADKVAKEGSMGRPDSANGPLTTANKTLGERETTLLQEFKLP